MNVESLLGSEKRAQLFAQEWLLRLIPVWILSPEIRVYDENNALKRISLRFSMVGIWRAAIYIAKTLSGVCDASRQNSAKGVGANYGIIVPMA